MSYKIYESGNIIISSKKEMEVGQEADIADEVFDACLKGYRTFAEHLQDKKEFYEVLRKRLVEIIDNHLK